MGFRGKARCDVRGRVHDKISMRDSEWKIAPRSWTRAFYTRFAASLGLAHR